MKNKYKPILFSSEVIPGIIDRIKKQTRRIKNESSKPLYQAGDILYVRETVRIGAWDEGYAAFAFDYAASPNIKKTPFIEFPVNKHFKMLSKALSKLDALGIKPYTWKPGESPLPWIPSIHMPKEAARIFLRVKNVRSERLQEISESDAIAEGIKTIVHDGQSIYYFYPCNDLRDDSYLDYPITSFYSLWRSIYGEESWKQNPLVWVYEFEVIEKPEDFGIN